ncbi:Cytochrome c [Balamuthia mandrillaris]
MASTMNKPCPPGGSVDKGEKLFKARCTQCHTINKGGPHKQGPNLYGLLGRKSGTVPGYKYTKANQDAGITWTEDTLFNYLENPKKYIPKTKMAFPGFKSEADRADVVAYLAKASAE